MYWLDYSAAKLSGSTIRDAGYGGVIRYIDAPNRLGTKHTNKAEYQSDLAAGIGVRLVMEVATGDADGGWTRGVEYAQRAKAGADFIGFNGVIYFCNDKPTLSSSTLWDDYLTGAASVLGWPRAGAYGFANAMDVASHMTPCQHFWQAGRRSDVRPFVQLWQDNNTQVNVGGITCDRNLVLKDLTTEDTMSEADAWNGVANLIRSLAREDGAEIRKILVGVIAEGAWNGVADMFKAVRDGKAEDVKAILNSLGNAQATVQLTQEQLTAVTAGLAPAAREGLRQLLEAASKVA